MNHPLQNIQNNPVNNRELPLLFQVSFAKVVQLYSSSNNGSWQTYMRQTEDYLEQFPELNNGLTDLSLISRFRREIDHILQPLFPPDASTLEAKAAILPFLFRFLKVSPQFESLWQHAKDPGAGNITGVHPDEIYIRACEMILSVCYGYDTGYRHDFYLNVPGREKGDEKYYRFTLNPAFSEIVPAKHAPKLSEQDFRELAGNRGNVKLWKQMFPPGSYIFRGFALASLTDFTEEYKRIVLHERLLENKDDKMEVIEQSLRKYLLVGDLKTGYSVFNLAYRNPAGSSLETKESLFLDEPEIFYRRYFPAQMVASVFRERKVFALPDIRKPVDGLAGSIFYRDIQKNNIRSLILVPVMMKGGNQLALIELASEKPDALNLLVQHRLENIRPVLEASLERIVRRFDTRIELAIQKECTPVHPSVRWKFRQAAIRYLKNREENRQAGFEKIVFESVYPLYGQTDVKGSSETRNSATAKDLTVQLKLAREILRGIGEQEHSASCAGCLDDIENFMVELDQEFRVDTEAQIIKFFSEKVDPEFHRLLRKEGSQADTIRQYYKKIDRSLGTIYNYRKSYDNTIAIINKKMAALLDFRQTEAQQIFPHLFERYKTDGVEHSMYAGASIAGNRTFSKKHLQNLRLWQLQVICQIENEFYNNKQNYPLLLKVASLVFVFNKPINISFINDEKQFDIDGTYNARYEIIKKRIDKAKVKGSGKRITEPGFITIIYSDEEDGREYLNYIGFLQSKNVLNDKIEQAEVEDLQDITGLRILKAGIVFQNGTDGESDCRYYYY